MTWSTKGKGEAKQSRAMSLASARYGESPKGEALSEHGVNCYSADTIAGPWKFEGRALRPRSHAAFRARGGSRERLGPQTVGSDLTACVSDWDSELAECDRRAAGGAARRPELPGLLRRGCGGSLHRVLGRCRGRDEAANGDL